MTLRPITFAFALALGAASCAYPGRPRPRLAARRPPRPLAAQERRRIDQEYYEAVEAYLKADYARARAMIRKMLAADPGYADALALRGRVKAVEKASAATP